MAGIAQAVVTEALNSTSRIVLRELKRYMNTSDVWRELLRYADVIDKRDLEKLTIDNRYETARDAKIKLSENVISLFENEVWDSVNDYLAGNYGSYGQKFRQKGGWYGLDDPIVAIVNRYLDDFRSGRYTEKLRARGIYHDDLNEDELPTAPVRYAKAIMKWKNSPKYAKFTAMDWYLPWSVIDEHGGYSDELLMELTGVKKLEAIKEIWMRETNA